MEKIAGEKDHVSLLLVGDLEYFLERGEAIFSTNGIFLVVTKVHVRRH